MLHAAGEHLHGGGLAVEVAARTRADVGDADVSVTSADALRDGTPNSGHVRWLEVDLRDPVELQTPRHLSGTRLGLGDVLTVRTLVPRAQADAMVSEIPPALKARDVLHGPRLGLRLAREQPRAALPRAHPVRPPAVEVGGVNGDDDIGLAAAQLPRGAVAHVTARLRPPLLAPPRRVWLARVPRGRVRDPLSVLGHGPREPCCALLAGEAVCRLRRELGVGPVGLGALVCAPRAVPEGVRGRVDGARVVAVLARARRLVPREPDLAREPARRVGPPARRVRHRERAAARRVGVERLHAPCARPRARRARVLLAAGPLRALRQGRAKERHVVRAREAHALPRPVQPRKALPRARRPVGGPLRFVWLRGALLARRLAALPPVPQLAAHAAREARFVGDRIWDFRRAADSVVRVIAALEALHAAPAVGPARARIVTPHAVGGERRPLFRPQHLCEELRARDAHTRRPHCVPVVPRFAHKVAARHRARRERDVGPGGVFGLGRARPARPPAALVPLDRHPHARAAALEPLRPVGHVGARLARGPRSVGRVAPIAQEGARRAARVVDGVGGHLSGAALPAARRLGVPIDARPRRGPAVADLVEPEGVVGEGRARLGRQHLGEEVRARDTHAWREDGVPVEIVRAHVPALLEPRLRRDGLPLRVCGLGRARLARARLARAAEARVGGPHALGRAVKPRRVRGLRRAELRHDLRAHDALRLGARRRVEEALRARPLALPRHVLLSGLGRRVPRRARHTRPPPRGGLEPCVAAPRALGLPVEPRGVAGLGHGDGRGGVGGAWLTPLPKVPLGARVVTRAIVDAHALGEARGARGRARARRPLVRRAPRALGKVHLVALEGRQGCVCEPAPRGAVGVHVEQPIDRAARRSWAMVVGRPEPHEPPVHGHGGPHAVLRALRGRAVDEPVLHHAPPHGVHAHDVARVLPRGARHDEVLPVLRGLVEREAKLRPPPAPHHTHALHRRPRVPLHHAVHADRPKVVRGPRGAHDEVLRLER
mmetsp:Transcript_65470/g.161219  ORF Transcript_65470/g.161219 Transcript_65470/m.161219 type:complete len:1007 (+) Transcript_65470:1844-4864(+)